MADGLMIENFHWEAAMAPAVSKYYKVESPKVMIVLFKQNQTQM